MTAPRASSTRRSRKPIASSSSQDVPASNHSRGLAAPAVAADEVEAELAQVAGLEQPDLARHEVVVEELHRALTIVTGGPAVNRLAYDRRRPIMKEESMTSTPPPPPPPPAHGYERPYYRMPPVPAPNGELIVFLLVWVVVAHRHRRGRRGRLARVPDRDGRPRGRVHDLPRHRQGRQGLREAARTRLAGRGPSLARASGFPLPCGAFRGVPFWPHASKGLVLTVQDIAELPELDLAVAAGADGLRQRGQLAPRLRAGRPDPVPRGRRVPAHDRPRRRRDGRRRSAPTSAGWPSTGVAGLGFGLGFGFPDVPAPIVEEAEQARLPGPRRPVRGARSWRSRRRRSRTSRTSSSSS